jgi:hypothetical protein
MLEDPEDARKMGSPQLGFAIVEGECGDYFDETKSKPRTMRAETKRRGLR